MGGEPLNLPHGYWPEEQVGKRLDRCCSPDADGSPLVTTARFWLNLQAAHDLETAEDELSRTIQREVRPAVALTSAGPRS